MIIEQKVCGRINGYNSFGNPIGLKIDEMWSFVGNKKKRYVFGDEDRAW
jgi:hypothetical protein